MRSSSVPPLRARSPRNSATTLIGLGLAILVIAPEWPDAPVVTAMAIIALGATEATIARFRGTWSMLPVVVLHGATYAGLYGLFIGATLHAAAARPTTSTNGWLILDVALSVIPMAVALQHIASALRRSFSPQR